MLFVAGMTGLHLMIDFRGLSSAAGMEQAQAARELARGNGLTSKMFRPLTLAKRQGARNAGGEDGPDWYAPRKATFFGPLNSLLNAAALKVSGWEYPASPSYRIYFPDRVIAAVSMLCFLGAVGASFLAANRLFNGTVAAVMAVIMLTSELCWRFSQSGLPQMLGLLLFSLGILGLISALERWRLGRVPLLPLIFSALCFGLLVLALPVAMGVTLGAAVYCGRAFRKRILVPVFFWMVVAAVLAPWMMWNFRHTGNVLGDGFFQVYESWGPSNGSRLMRTFDPSGESLPPIDLAKKTLKVFAQHFERYWTFIGGIIVAPLFFVALMHAFRSPEARGLRWGVLTMWLGAMAGMGMVGTPEGALDPNQLHILFLPVMTAYGLSLVGVLWERTPLAQNPFSRWRFTPWIVLVVLCAVPLFSDLKGRTLYGITFRNRMIQWPPYDPAGLGHLGQWTDSDSLIFSDIPWAVSWYADRPAMWIPVRPQQYEKLYLAWEKTGGQVGGMFLSPHALDGRLATEVMNGDYREWSRILMRGQVLRFGVDLFEDNLPPPLKHWQRLSPTRNHEAWFIAKEPVWLDGAM
jgi:hypothetical protein